MTAEKPITQQEMEQAAADESQQMASSVQVMMAQNAHLNQRVVLLRAALNRVQAENEEMRKALPKNWTPRKRPVKKVAKKATTKKR